MEFVLHTLQGLHMLQMSQDKMVPSVRFGVKLPARAEADNDNLGRSCGGDWNLCLLHDFAFLRV
jgi:hypothetical protein